MPPTNSLKIERAHTPNRPQHTAMSQASPAAGAVTSLPSAAELQRRRRARTPPTPSRTTTQRCLRCGSNWTACRCGTSEPAATETIASLLEGCRGLGGGHLQHLHVFVYVGYRRWAAALSDEHFSAVCMPPYEGWYGCWIRPGGLPPSRIGGFDEPVLQVDLIYDDGTSQRAFITRAGQLVGVVPATSPRFAVQLDPDSTCLQFETIAVARLLTMHEIDAARRGVVHGSCATMNNARKVSHIVGADAAGDYVLRRIPHIDYDDVELARLPVELVKTYAPEIYNEYSFRRSATLTKSAANAMLPYLDSFFLRAVQDDLAAREAYQGGEGVGDVDVMPEELARRLRDLKLRFREIDAEDGDKVGEEQMDA